MPDVPKRDALEKELANKIAKVLGDSNKDFTRLLIASNFDLSDPGVLAAYQKMDLKVQKATAPFIQNLMESQGAHLAKELSLDVDWVLINQQAANWARGYSTILSGQVATTSRDRIATSIRGSISKFYTDGMTIGELTRRLEADKDLAHLFTEDVKDKLGRVFGPGRAEMIARTEITRAAAEGERFVAYQWIQKGHQLVEIWHTKNDEIVCVICGPRNNRKEGTNWNRNQGPPAHPRCRCWVAFELPSKTTRQPDYIAPTRTPKIPGT